MVMRTWFSGLLLAAGILVGYAAAPRSVNAQPEPLLFTPGATFILTFENGRNQVTCTVTNKRDEFIGCTTERVGVEDRETWYNLRFVERVTRARR
jgi:hypothetical protein